LSGRQRKALESPNKDNAAQLETSTYEGTSEQDWDFFAQIP